MSSQPASQLDAADPLARFRSRFVAADDPSVVAYLDGNSLGRPLTVTGERLAAFVVLGSGASADADALKQHVKENLANYKVPREIAVVDELPRGSTGKILRAELQARVTG